jgi:hypothetical protein
MPPVGLQPTVPVGERTYTYALDRAATGTGSNFLSYTSSFINVYFIALGFERITGMRKFRNAVLCS